MSGRVGGETVRRRGAVGADSRGSIMGGGGQDVVAPGRMRRKIHNPRILLMDCPLEYKKGENQTNVELTKEEDWCARLCRRCSPAPPPPPPPPTPRLLPSTHATRLGATERHTRSSCGWTAAHV